MKKLIIFLLLICSIFLFIYYYPQLRSTRNLFSKRIDIKLDYDTIYLVVDETKEITSNVDNVMWSSEDELVATVDNGKVTAISVGETTITASINKNKASVNVIVTDLISMPIVDNEKEYLTCNRYTESESNLLDNILAYKVEDAGYLTRAGAVAAARFLTLEFKYRINYFLENGRLITTGGRTLCDGEGRYYHTGLYLSESKYSTISVSNHGPAIWGCPLYNGISGTYEANGLDCSGFITWALVNAGYDPGDGGAGINDSISTDMDDLGEKIKINTDSISNNKFKVGDLLVRYGHVGMIIGIEDDTIYIAEALDEDLHVLIQNKSNLSSTWTYIINMDDFYGDDGNITNMWYN